jgi:tetratricopeptide (TPR) repeat protein
MKLIHTLIYLIVAINISSAQTFKKSSVITKSDSPLEFNADLNYSIEDIDSSLVSNELVVKFRLIDSLIEKKKKEKAISLLNEVELRNPEKYYVPLLKGMLYLKLDDLNSSHDLIKKSISLTLNDSIKSSLYYTLGIIYMKRNLHLNSYENLQKAYELDSLSLSTLIVFGYVSRKLNKINEAISLYEKAVKLDPTLNNVWNNLGFLYQKSGNHKKAKKVFSKIIKDEPKSPLPYSNRSYSNLKLGFNKQALKDINKSIKLFPENSYAFRNRALIYIASNEFESACEDINMALELGYTQKYGSDVTLLKNEHCER